MRTVAVEDRFALVDLIAEYAYMWDGRDADGWSNLFTEDASWEMHDSGSAGTEVTVRSRSEIRAAAGVQPVFCGWSRSQFPLPRCR